MKRRSSGQKSAASIQRTLVKNERTVPCRVVGMSKCTALQTLMTIVLRQREKIPMVPRNFGSGIHRTEAVPALVLESSIV